MTRGLFGSGPGGFTVRDSPDQYFKAYYQKNKKKISERMKQRYAANPEKYKAKRKLDYENKLIKDKKLLEEGIAAGVKEALDKLNAEKAE